jgi:hypothetical protein
MSEQGSMPDQTTLASSPHRDLPQLANPQPPHPERPRTFDDLTLPEARFMLEYAKGVIARLTGENEGLHERVEQLEAQNHELNETAETLYENMREWHDFFEENGNSIIALKERNDELEGEVLMLRRRRGSGVGRGRPAEWTQGEAATVREMRAAGASLGQIAGSTRLSVSQVRTILKSRPPTEEALSSREERIARRLLEARRCSAAVANFMQRAGQLKVAVEKERKERKKRARRRT